MNLPATALAKRALRSSLLRRVSKDVPPLASRATSTLIASSSVQTQPTTSTTTNHQERNLSTYPPSLRSNPQYTVFGENCLLSLKIILPHFRVIQPGKTPILAMDNSNRGRMILEWIPRDAEGKTNRDATIRFALSPEECGLVLDQIPKNQEVVLLRRLSLNPQYDVGQELPEKVLHIIPGQGGMVSFKVDFELNGVGGQAAGGNQSPDVVGPLEVVCQAGELQVMLSLIQSTIPHLVGWTTQMDVAIQSAVGLALRNHGNGGGGGGGGFHGNNPRFSTSDSSYNDY